MRKYRYNINNLDCANCAREIEQMLNKHPQINNAVVNFSTSKVSFESDESFSMDDVNVMIKKVEPDAFLTNEKNNAPKEYHMWTLILGIVLGVLGSKINNAYVGNIVSILAYGLLLYRPIINTCKTLVKSSSINENMLITVSCIGAYLVGQKMEGIMVIALYTIGKILEEKAVNNSRKSIGDLISIKQNYANKKVNGVIEEVDVNEINIGDTLVVKKGEKIPVDSVVVSGKTQLDTSMLTGESELVNAIAGDEVLSGTINMGDTIEIRSKNTFSDSTVSRILNLLEDATDKKTKTETFISKASKIYTPAVLLLAVLVAVFLPVLFRVNLSDSIYRALTFLVISCPCAIAISVPLSYFSGIGIASKNGILIKGSNYLDNLSKVKNIIFDKTGTLTNGEFKVTGIEIFDNEYTREDIIEIITKGESLSNHPIAKSILKLKQGPIDNGAVEDFKEMEGKGLSYTLDGKNIIIGTQKVCNCDEVAILHLNIDGKHVASIDIDDGIKESAFSAIQNLKKNKIKTYMFTGDKKEVALEVGKRLGIDEIKYEMLPTNKYAEYEKVANKGEITVFAGDGINDAPVLKRADIGISMGNVGSESAIEASDIVLMSGDINKIPLSINISKYTGSIIKQNLIFAMTIKVAILALSVLGLANMWFAVFADTGVTLLTILNTLRIMNKFK